jgi:hypothetical protein
VTTSDPVWMTIFSCSASTRRQRPSKAGIGRGVLMIESSRNLVGDFRNFSVLRS